MPAARTVSPIWRRRGAPPDATGEGVARSMLGRVLEHLVGGHPDDVRAATAIAAARLEAESPVDVQEDSPRQGHLCRRPRPQMATAGTSGGGIVHDRAIHEAVEPPAVPGPP